MGFRRAALRCSVNGEHDFVLADVLAGEIAETVGASKDRTGYILHEILDMKKRWVPRLLTPASATVRPLTAVFGASRRSFYVVS